MNEIELLTSINQHLEDIEILLIALIVWLVIKVIYRLFNFFF